jgi:hypothetical protein
VYSLMTDKNTRTAYAQARRTLLLLCAPTPGAGAYLPEFSGQRLPIHLDGKSASSHVSERVVFENHRGPDPAHKGKRLSVRQRR